MYFGSLTKPSDERSFSLGNNDTQYRTNPMCLILYTQTYIHTYLYECECICNIIIQSTVCIIIFYASYLYLQLFVLKQQSVCKNIHVLKKPNTFCTYTQDTPVFGIYCIVSCTVGQLCPIVSGSCPTNRKKLAALISNITILFLISSLQVADITQLRDFLLEHRKDYVNAGR